MRKGLFILAFGWILDQVATAPGRARREPDGRPGELQGPIEPNFSALKRAGIAGVDHEAE